VDLNGDGKTDLLGAAPDGSIWYYQGSGTAHAGSLGTKAGVRVANGWPALNAMLSPGDLNGDDRSDVLARTSNGDLEFTTGAISAPASGLGSARQAALGWDVFG
jgi:hypothetical protein